MIRLLITRPQQDSESLASKLSKHDIECIIEPMLTIVPEASAKEAIKPHLDPAPQAIVITSKHALEAFDDLSIIADIPLFASGARTAEFAREQGMKNVTATGEKVSELADYIATNLKPEKEPILYLSGADITTDLQDVLHDYKIIRLITYRADMTEAFSADVIKEIGKEALTGVIFFTQRSTAAFMNCIKQANLEIHLKALRAYCLSDAVAETLSPTLFKSVAIAAHPTVKSMVDLVVAKSKPKAETPPPPVIDIEVPLDKKSEKAKAEKAKAESALAASAAVKRGNGKWFAALLVTQLATIGYVATLPTHSLTQNGYSSSTPADSDEKLAALNDRLDKLETQYQEDRDKWASATPSADASIAPAGVTADELDSIREQLNEMTSRIAKAETKAENHKITDARMKEMIELKHQIDTLRQQIEHEQKDKWRQIQLLASYDALNKALSEGKSYTNPLVALKIAATDLPVMQEKLAILVLYQEKGIPTMRQLQEQFKQSVERYLQQAEANQGGFWERIKRNLSKLIVVRKVGESHEGNDELSRIARAEAALQKDQLTAAIEEIGALSEPALTNFAEWSDAAKSYLQAHEAATALYHEVMMTIGTEKQ